MCLIQRRTSIIPIITAGYGSPIGCSRLAFKRVALHAALVEAGHAEVSVAVLSGKTPELVRTGRRLGDRSDCEIVRVLRDVDESGCWRSK